MTDVAISSKPEGTPTATDQVVGIKGGLIQLFTIGDLPASGATGADTTYVDTGDANTLAAAASHADTGDAAVTAAANTRMDSGDAATLAAANAHADTAAANAQAAAEAYADSIGGAGGVSASYVDTGDANTLASANSHADSAASAAQTAAQTYADNGDSTTLASANSHADSGDTTTLNSAKAYTDAATVGGSFTMTDSGSVSRPMSTKVKEVEVSVLDFGADPTGAADSTAAFNSAQDSSANRIHVPSGTYKVTNLVLDLSKEWYGDGGALGLSTVNITTTATHGVKIIGDASLGTGNVIKLRGLKFNYTGTGMAAGYAGMLVQRKVYAEDIYVRGFTGDGIRFAPADAAADGSGGTIGNAVFFSHWQNCWSRYNGGDGIVIRMGANANTFINCQFSNNSGRGLHHVTDGGATYGNTIISGQCSYNSQEGYYFESGTNITTWGLYAEYNGSPSNTNADGYTNTNFDFYVGDNCSRSMISIGTVFNSTNAHVRAPNSGANDSILVTTGGDRLYGTAGATAYHTPHETSTMANSTATTVAGVVADLNAVISKLKTAGVIQ